MTLTFVIHPLFHYLGLGNNTVNDMGSDQKSTELFVYLFGAFYYFIQVGVVSIEFIWIKIKMDIGFV